MKAFIWKHFVKDYENTKDPEVRARYTRLTGTLGILVNSLLCVMKIVLGILTQSIAVIGDGLHDMADSLAACITLLGAHCARKPADRDHPYGHARIEYLASLVVSAIVLVVGVELFRSSFDKILHPMATEFSWLMIAIMLCAILLKGSSALFTIATGRHIASLPVIAAGIDNRNDVITSIVIVIGMLIHHYTGMNLDGHMGCLVALFILYSGIMLVRETIGPLLGEPPDRETIDAVKEIILSHAEILGFHDLIIYNYGPGKNFASFHAEVDAGMEMIHAHDLIDHIERELKQRLRMTVTCHMDPVETNDPVRRQMEQAVTEAARQFAVIEGFHDLRVVRDEDEDVRKVVFDLVVSAGNDYPAEDIAKAMDAAVKNMDEGAEAVIIYDQAFN
ncbi:MAG: cation diffusion facilitator family transporter [Bacillota bacterium]|nr:cation diffusion facilitator family transporter [Bacillota bacterium]